MPNCPARAEETDVGFGTEALVVALVRAVDHIEPRANAVKDCPED